MASLVLLADRRARHRSGWLPWTALADGTADSLAANIATTHPDAVSRIIAGWPAAALLIAVKLLTGILERPDVPDVVSVAADQANQATDSASTGSSVPGTMLTSPLGPAGNAHPAQVRSCPAESGHQQPSSSPAMADPALDSHAAALLPAARAARNELCQDGLPLTCDALAARLRQHGHPIRNASVTPLLRHLRHEQPTHLARLTHGQIANQRPASQSTGGTTGHRKADPPTRPTRAGRPRHAARAHSQHPNKPRPAPSAAPIRRAASPPERAAA